MAGQFREAEIGDPDGLMLIDEQIGGLDVPVQNPLIVGILDRLSRLRADARCEPPPLIARRRLIAPPVFEQRVEPPAADVLHGIVRHAVVLTEGKDRHDVCMVQPGDRQRLALKPLQPPGIELHLVDDLEGDASPQRFLNRLVDHPHPTATKLARDPKVAKLRGNRASDFPIRRVRRALAQPLDHRHGRQQRSNNLGVLGISLQEVGDRWCLTAATTFDEFFGDAFERVAFFVVAVDRLGGVSRRSCVTHVSPLRNSGNCSRTLRSRSTARTYRLLAAAGLIESDAAASRLLICSK